MLRVDYEQKMRTAEAAPEKMDPFKNVVRVAIQRVREGEVDSVNRFKY